MNVAHTFTLAVKGRSIAFPKPCVMGIINLSSDSFFQAIPNISDVLKKAEAMVAAGASFIDFGAVATNPKINMTASLPSEQLECDRLLPVIEAIANRLDVMISVDTSAPIVMRAAVSAGAHLINDQCALRTPKALETAVRLDVPVCLMHHFNPPRNAGSTECVALFLQIKTELMQYVQRCLQAGFSKAQLMIDPGFGNGNFGKNTDENFYVLSQLHQLVNLGYPILVGLSRKTMFGELLNIAVEDRLPASLSGAVIAAQQGAAIIRAHDVKETVDAMAVVRQIQKSQECEQLK